SATSSSNFSRVTETVNFSVAPGLTETAVPGAVTLSFLSPLPPPLLPVSPQPVRPTNKPAARTNDIHFIAGYHMVDNRHTDVAWEEEKAIAAPEGARGMKKPRPSCEGRGRFRQSGPVRRAVPGRGW